MQQAAFLPESVFAAKKRKGIIGVQLYSIRDEMGKDPLGSLTQVAKMGYKYVEHANYVNRKFYGYAPAEFKKVLDDLGLENDKRSHRNGTVSTGMNQKRISPTAGNILLKMPVYCSRGMWSVLRWITA